MRKGFLMPRIIRKALYLKLKELPELREFQRDFERLSGLQLVLVDDLGTCDADARSLSPMCAMLHEHPAGKKMCGRMRQSLLLQANEHPACAVCDAGMQEVAVPLRISGIPAGYFLFGGVLRQRPDHVSVQKARHLLRHHGVDTAEEELNRLLEDSPRVTPEAMEAWQRIAHLAARQIAMKLTDRLVDPETSMPPVVKKACGYIRGRSLVEDVGLADVARHCAVSEGHLSRLFHHATGLTFREYITQVRLEHAKGMVLHGGRGITEIAYESGFQSVSQFHRSFRKSFGVSPGEMRRLSRSEAVSGEMVQPVV